MTPEERVAALEAENASLRGGPMARNAMSYEALKNNRAFQAFCRPRLNGKIPTMAEILAAKRKARAAEFKAFCKPKGIWSILKSGPYTTGRLMGKDEVYTREETAKLIRYRRADGAMAWDSELEGDLAADGWAEIPQNVPDFGKDAPGSQQTPPESAQDEPDQPNSDAEALERLLALTEEQNRLLRQIVDRRAA